jgi:hypothetical protein
VTNNLPPEFDPLLAELAEQPEHAREMWRYAIVLMMIEDEKARVRDGTIEALTIEPEGGSGGFVWDPITAASSPLCNNPRRFDKGSKSSNARESFPKKLIFRP